MTYHGGERNFPALKVGASTFEGTDGTAHDRPATPDDVDGVRVDYMEKAGKKFAAVRVQRGADDVVLEHEVLIDPPTHMGYGKRFGHEPTLVDDEAMATLLADIIAKNPGQRNELSRVRGSFSVTARGRA